MYHLFDSYIREVGIPRKVVTNRKDFMNYFNLKNGKASIYSTVYAFAQRNELKPWLADYSTAYMDRIFFDIDGKNSYETLLKLVDYCLGEDLVFRMQFSGGGYHALIFSTLYNLQNPKAALELSQRHILDKSGIHIDEVDSKIIGDIARFFRVTYSWNMRRKAFCIPVTLDMLDKGDDYIRKVSKDKNLKRLKSSDWLYGSNKFKLSKFDQSPTYNYYDNIYEDEVFKLKEVREIPELAEIKSRINCKAIRDILDNENANYRERYHLILYLKEVGYGILEVKEILAKFLTEKKLKHCLYEENQPGYIFRRDDLFLATCQMMRKDGICGYECKQEGCNLEAIYA